MYLKESLFMKFFLYNQLNELEAKMIAENIEKILYK